MELGIGQIKSEVVGFAEKKNLPAKTPGKCAEHDSVGEGRG